MALRKMLSGRFFHLSKHSSTCPGYPSQSPYLRKVLTSSTTAGPSNSRILLQRRSISQSGAASTVPPTSFWNPQPAGEKLIEQIRSSIMQDRIRIDSFAPPLPDKEVEREKYRMEISVADLKKLFKEWQMEGARAKLRGIPTSYVSYSEFAEICREAAGGSHECAREIAASLDHSGAVIVLADVVFLRPEQVGPIGANERVTTPQPTSHCDELKEIEAEKAVIDRKAEAEVKRELWAGLGLMLIQTVGFMRLTFWELSWDIMEPICFFTTSIYFMLGYAFFLRTAQEPSFEGFFLNRFAAKQKRLMKSRGFDLSKYNQLKRAPPIRGSAPAPM